MKRLLYEIMELIKATIKDVRDFFRSEKAYALLLLISLITFIVCVIMLEPYEAPASPALAKFKQVETLQQTAGEEKILSLIEIDRTAKFFTYLFHYGIVLLFFAGIALNIKVFLRIRRKREIIQPLFTTTTVWDMRDVAKFFIMLFAFMLTMSLFARYVALLMGQDQPDTSYVVVHGSIIDLGALFLILHYAIWQHKSSVREIGLRIGTFWKDVKLGLLAYSWLLPLFFVLVILVGVIAKVFNYEPPPHALIDVLIVADKRNPFIVFYSIFLACALGPFVEELFFRGFLYDAIRKRWGMPSAIILTSGFFAYVHESLFAFVPIFFLGVILAYLREKRGSLIPSITMHIIHNSVLLTYFFIIKRAVIDNM
jgi:uncharacterized protein